MSDAEMKAGLRTFLNGGSDFCDDETLRKVRAEANTVLASREAEAEDARTSRLVKRLEAGGALWIRRSGERRAHAFTARVHEDGWLRTHIACGRTGYALSPESDWSWIAEGASERPPREHCKTCAKKLAGS